MELVPAFFFFFNNMHELSIFQWNSSLEEISSSPINFFLKQYARSRQIQNILKNFVELISTRDEFQLC
jgi:hypothetical protein